MNDIPMTVVGNVVNDVTLRFTGSGEPVASFRVAAGTRRYDRSNEKWVDGDTHFFTVSCWRFLAHNVVQTVTKGMPVVVTGRLRSRQFDRPCGDSSHSTTFHDIEAQAVGPDLSWGVAQFTRVKRTSVTESEERHLADEMLVEAAREDEDSLTEIDLETGEILPAAS